ncbi:MAG: AAA family ATPase [Thermodesulfobacteriota bacterium]|nr:AAA family ATPase [Thermodesulfobacteriota bacterium]
MKRDIYNKLIAWKEHPRHNPLVLKGARQVGKTYILQDFGKKEYEDIAHFNFEEDPHLRDFFTGRLAPEKIIQTLSIYREKKSIPNTH